MVQDNRIEWVDMLKGIAILWLVVYHMYIFDWMGSPVPVFFFLSGLFFSEGKSFDFFIRKKTQALLVPLLFFFFLGIASSWLRCLLLGEVYTFPQLWLFATLIPAGAEVTNPLGVGAIWFLVSLFEIYIIYYVLRLLSKNSWWLFAAGIMLYIVSFIASQYYANGSLLYLFYTFGFCIFFIVAHQVRDKLLYCKIHIRLIIMAVVAYSMKFVDVSYMFNVDNWGGAFLLKVKGLISMAGLIVLLIWLCKILSAIRPFSESKINGFMLYEGRNSLTILGVHMLAMAVVNLLFNRFHNNVIYYLFLFVITIGICNICILLFIRYVPFFVNHKNKVNKNEKVSSVFSKEL